MDNKGFMMAEVIVVSAIILVVLTGLYTSYNKIFSIYNQRVSYYDVDTLYELGYIRDSIDLDLKSPNVNTPVYNNNGKLVYYINKFDVKNLNVSNKTFKEYLEFLSGSLDFENMEVEEKNVTNILVMEKCENDGLTNCKYAYLEVSDEEETE